MVIKKDEVKVVSVNPRAFWDMLKEKVLKRWESLKDRGHMEEEEFKLIPAGAAYRCVGSFRYSLWTHMFLRSFGVDMRVEIEDSISEGPDGPADLTLKYETSHKGVETVKEDLMDDIAYAEKHTKFIAPKPAARPAPAKAGGAACPSCGEPVGPKDAFCAACGAKLGGSSGGD